MRIHKNMSKSIDTEKESDIEKKMNSLIKTTKELIHETNREMVAELIIEAKEKHGDKYDYSKVVYENNLKEVIIKKFYF
jgi:hydrogenase maturation factor HypE